MLAITPVRVVMNRKVIEDQTVLVEDGRIVGVRDASLPLPITISSIIEGHGCLLIPGMIDVHIHGASGFDMTDGETTSILETSMTCAKTGCTGFLVTSLTSSLSDLLKMIETVKKVRGKEHGAQIFGIHLEGPYLNEKRKGMQNPLYLRHPDTQEMKLILNAASGFVKMVTLAPELPNALELIELLVAEGIITSIGHSDATYEEACEAFACGVSHVTHCFNALRPIHQRDPGALVAAMENPNVICEAIVDHVHLHPAIVRLLYRNKGIEGMILITDAMQAMGIGDGHYRFGGHDVNVIEGVARLADGNLASSTITMNRALQKTVQCGIPLTDAVAMATETPADMLGLSHKGRIAVGHFADVVLLNDDFDVLMTMVEGKVIFQTSK